MISRLHVHYRGWGERWPLGTLAVAAGGRLLFEYSPQAVERGIEFSPLHAPLPRAGAAARAITGPVHCHGLPGFVADSLPDGWGMLLMDRALRRAGRDPRTVSALARLAIIGDSGIGALAFEPADPLEAQLSGVLEIATLAREMQAAAADNEDRGSAEQLHRLLLLGGSPQGARPKALLRWQRASDQFFSDAQGAAAGQAWLLKFPAPGEHAEVCAIEAFYARLAGDGGLDMPEAAHFSLPGGHAAFGVRRFDRVDTAAGEQRVPLMSLAALLHADHSLPALDYETLLLATLRLTGDQREVRKAFERCVFNVLTHNRDDHAKNFAFRLDAQGRWKLSPAFDITFSQGPGGEHFTSVAGEGRLPARAQLLQVARRGGLSAADARACIEHWRVALTPRPALLQDLPIRKRTLQAMRAKLEPIWNIA